MSENEVVLLVRVAMAHRERKVFSAADNPSHKLSALQSFGADAIVEVLDVLRGEGPEVRSKLPVRFVACDCCPLSVRKGVHLQITGKIQQLTKTKQAFRVTSYLISMQSASNTTKTRLGADPQEMRNNIIRNTDDGERLSDGLPEDVPAELFTTQIAAIQESLCANGLPNFDLEVAYDIQTFFDRRTKRYARDGEEAPSVASIILDNPYILSDMPDQSTFQLYNLCKHFEKTGKKPLPKEILVAQSISAILQRQARLGNSCYPLNKIVGELFPVFKRFNMTDYKQNHQFVYDLLTKASELPGKYLSRVSFCGPREKGIAGELPAMDDYYENQLSAASQPLKTVDQLHNVIYLRKNLVCEQKAAALFNARAEYAPLPNYIKDIEKGTGFNQKQKKALLNAFNYRISFLCGGGGTGKTYTVHCLIDLLRAHNETAIILAPSAMAAVLAAKRADFKADYMTVSRFTCMMPEDADYGEIGFLHNTEFNTEKHPVPRFIIIDEASMCTIPMLYKILYQIRSFPDIRLLFVGDPAQLPAIGPQFFAQATSSLLSSVAPTTVLTENQRTADSNLQSLASDIRNGVFRLPDCPEIVQFNGSDRAQANTQKMLKEFREAYPEISTADTFFLANRRDAVESLNRALRKPGLVPVKITYGKTSSDSVRFYVGDPVVSTRNDYANRESDIFNKIRNEQRNVDVYNGTKGVITRVEGTVVYVSLELPDRPGGAVEVPYNSVELPVYFDPAYAMTVHKAQGSEADTVVYFIDPADHINRNMVYTAATRARKRVFFVGATEDFVNGAATMLVPAYSRFAFRVLQHRLHDADDEE